MEKDVKFTISVIRNGYLKEEYRPKYEILGYREVAQKVSDFVEGYEEPIHGRCIGTEVVDVSYESIVNEYEQIPLIVGDMPFSVIRTNDESDMGGKGMEIYRKISQMGEFCSAEKLEEIVSEYNKYRSGYRHGTYSINYGYQYTNISGKKIRRNFENQADRNQSALNETGYNFDILDWSDKIGPDVKQDIPQQAIKK